MKRGKAKLANEGVGIRLALVHQPGNTLTSDLTRDNTDSRELERSSQEERFFIKYIDVSLTGFFFQKPMPDQKCFKTKKQMLIWKQKKKEM